MNTENPIKIIHADIDYFYAQVEILANPKLKNKPVIVSGTSNHSVVLTCNYLAREFNVYSGLSYHKAQQRCPNGIFIPPNMKIYKEYSRKMHKIFRRYTDRIEPIALDEAYLDVTNNKLHMKSATIIAQKIQNDILNELNLTCSFGVSYNKFLAKIASDYKKPQGLMVVTPQVAPEFLKTLPIEKIPGVGKKSLIKYYINNIHTTGDLLQYSEMELVKKFGSFGHKLYHYARGNGSDQVAIKKHNKSFGYERTLEKYILSKNDLLEILYTFLEKIITRLNEQKMRAKTITIKIKYRDFKLVTKSKSIDYPTSCYSTLKETIEYIVETLAIVNEVRLVGLSVSNLNNNQKMEQIFFDI